MSAKNPKPVVKMDRGFRIRPHSLYLCGSSGPGTFTYAAAEYEARWWVGGEYHSRIDQGPPVYAHDHPDLRLAFLVASAAMSEIRARADGQTGDPEWRKKVRAYLAEQFGARDGGC